MHNMMNSLVPANVIANLDHLLIEHATPHAVGLINTTARLEAVPNGRWASVGKKS